jgi:hypothetical protein
MTDDRHTGLRLIDLLKTPAIGDAESLFAPQTRFRSPFTDYTRREDVVHLLGQICQVLTDVQVTSELHGADTTMSAFDARVAGEEVQGVLVEHRDGGGRLTDAMLTLRPYSGLRASMRAMQALMEESPLPSHRDQR